MKCFNSVLCRSILLLFTSSIFFIKCSEPEIKLVNNSTIPIEKTVPSGNIDKCDIYFKSLLHVEKKETATNQYMAGQVIYSGIMTYHLDRMIDYFRTIDYFVENQTQTRHISSVTPSSLDLHAKFFYYGSYHELTMQPIDNPNPDPNDHGEYPLFLMGPPYETVTVDIFRRPMNSISNFTFDSQVEEFGHYQDNILVDQSYDYLFMLRYHESWTAEITSTIHAGVVAHENRQNIWGEIYQHLTGVENHSICGTGSQNVQLYQARLSNGGFDPFLSVEKYRIKVYKRTKETENPWVYQYSIRNYDSDNTIYLDGISDYKFESIPTLEEW
jgi:hypothetical protein